MVETAEVVRSGGGSASRASGGTKRPDTPNGATVNQKYGIAQALDVFRSSETDLNGEPYKNTRGLAYLGSVCDSCEERRQTNGDETSFHHHPLRCNRLYPKWRTNPPEEEDPEVMIYTRGGDTVCFADLK